MLNYQSTSFHDALYIRKLLKLKPAPEFGAWLKKMGMMNARHEITGAKNTMRFLDDLNGLTV
jgi:ethanolamine ammonia-lyase large subunit